MHAVTDGGPGLRLSTRTECGHVIVALGGGVAAEKNSTLVMPFPAELLCFFGRATTAAGQPQPPAAVQAETRTPRHPHPQRPPPGNARLPAAASSTATTSHGNGQKTPAVFRTAIREYLSPRFSHYQSAFDAFQSLVPGAGLRGFPKLMSMFSKLCRSVWAQEM
jgi:hypothetical protein